MAGQDATLIDWAAIAALLLPRQAPGPDRPAYAPLAKLKATLIAQWYQLLDPALDEALADRVSPRRFCGFGRDERSAEETTVCRFRRTVSARRCASVLVAELDRRAAMLAA